MCQSYMCLKIKKYTYNIQIIIKFVNVPICLKSEQFQLNSTIRLNQRA